MENEMMMMQENMGMCPMCQQGWLGITLSFILYAAILAVLIALTIYLIRKSKTL